MQWSGQNIIWWKKWNSGMPCWIKVLIFHRCTYKWYTFILWYSNIYLITITKGNKNVIMKENLLPNFEWYYKKKRKLREGIYHRNFVRLQFLTKKKKKKKDGVKKKKKEKCMGPSPKFSAIKKIYIWKISEVCVVYAWELWRNVGSPSNFAPPLPP